MVGVFASPELTVELRGAEGEIVHGGNRMPFRASIGPDGAIAGRFVAGGHEFAFRARVHGDTLHFETDGTVYVLARQGVAPANPLARPAARAAAAPAPGQRFRHPTGAELVVPPGWTAQPGPGGVQLVPPGAAFGPTGPAEIYLVAAQPAPGVARGDDPRILAYLDAACAQLVPGAQRTGPPEPLGDGVRVRYRARNASTGGELALVSMVRIVRGMAVGVTGIGEPGTVAGRLPALEGVFASIAWGPGDLDPALVGVWHHWSYRSSGSIAMGSSHSVETRAVVQLGPDGSALMRTGSETSTHLQGRDGYGERSWNAGIHGQGQGGRAGTWSAGGGMLYVQWSDGTQVAARYHVGGPPGGRRVVLEVAGQDKPVEWTEQPVQV
jgi:hypothetical protein